MNKTPEKYDQWNDKKKSIEFSVNKEIDMKIGELFWYTEGMNIGNEISKDGAFKRVCIVLNNNLGNGLLLVAPLTTKYKKWLQNYVIRIENFQKYSLKESYLILNQIKLVDKKRIQGKLSDIRLPFGFIIYVLKHYVNIISLKQKNSHQGESFL